MLRYLASLDSEGNARVGLRAIEATHPCAALSGADIDDLVASFEGKGYGDLKAEVAQVVVDFVTPFRDRVHELLDDRSELESILAAGAERATEVSEATLRDVYDRVGFLPRAGS